MTIARRIVAALVLAAAASACSAPTAPPSGSPTATDAPGDALLEVFDVPVGDITQMDVFAAPDGTGMPTLVLLHGTAGDRTRLHPLARALASRGAAVFVPSWPIIETPGASRNDPERYRIQVEVVICSLRAARTSTVAYGGDPDQLTVVGYSGGASVGATASLVAAPPWAGIDCQPGVDHGPVRFIGLAGDYHGDYQDGRVDAATYASFDPFAIEPSREVVVRLIHGLNDQVVNTYVSGQLVDHLVSEGLDARLVVTESAHGEMIDPESGAGSFVADQIDALAHGRPSVFNARVTVHAGITFDDRTCAYTGPTALAVGDVVEIRLRNSGAGAASFGLTSVAADTDRELLEAPMESMYVGSAARFGLAVSNHPSWIIWGGFRHVPEPRGAEWRWAVTEHRYAWLPVCFVDQPGREDHGLVVRGTDQSGALVVLAIE